MKKLLLFIGALGCMAVANAQRTKIYGVRLEGDTVFCSGDKVSLTAETFSCNEKRYKQKEFKKLVLGERVLEALPIRGDKMTRLQEVVFTGEKYKLVVFRQSYTQYYSIFTLDDKPVKQKMGVTEGSSSEAEEVYKKLKAYFPECQAFQDTLDQLAKDNKALGDEIHNMTCDK